MTTRRDLDASLRRLGVFPMPLCADSALRGGLTGSRSGAATAPATVAVARLTSRAITRGRFGRGCAGGVGQRRDLLAGARALTVAVVGGAFAPGALARLALA